MPACSWLRDRHTCFSIGRVYLRESLKNKAAARLPYPPLAPTPALLPRPRRERWAAIEGAFPSETATGAPPRWIKERRDRLENLFISEQRSCCSVWAGFNSIVTGRSFLIDYFSSGRTLPRLAFSVAPVISRILVSMTRDDIVYVNVHVDIFFSCCFYTFAPFVRALHLPRNLTVLFFISFKISPKKMLTCARLLVTRLTNTINAYYTQLWHCFYKVCV